MKTMYLTVRNGSFANVKGEYDEMSRDKAIGNGWNCEILGDGKIRCVTSGVSNKEAWSLIYTIRPDGFARIVYKKDSEKIPMTIKKGFVVKKGEAINGVIIMLREESISGTKAKVFFRDEALQEFLDKYKLSTVMKENPNRPYTLNVYNTDEVEYRELLYTDGIITQEESDEEYPNMEKRHIRVKNARWVVIKKIHTSKKSGGKLTNYVKVLYTLGNPLRLNLAEQLDD